MTENTTSEDEQDLQAKIVNSMREFAAQNPAITEAMAVMNMTMPEYLQAIEAIRGGQIVSASSVVWPADLPAAF